ncbi:MAG: hypothetical protein FJ313_05910 [Gemmatimonadetes bacterium]|nr:hypothetical protein [Gemmatimonadota bacterium]
MDLRFERGDPRSPRGHAILFFRDTADPEAVAATYIVILPVAVDIARYVPPFLAGQVESMGASDFSAFALPPAPERVGSFSDLKRIAESRGDDLVFGGRGDLDNPAELLNEVGETVAEYARRYQEWTGRLATEPAGEAHEEPAGGVDDVVYALMSEADRLSELTSMTGRLRYAIEGGDRETAAEATTRIRAIARHMPPNRRAERLIELASDPSPKAAYLAQLYLERAYGLLREDYLRVKALDERITQAEADLRG